MKTLFFNLSSPDVFRNLFFFPGSVHSHMMNALYARPELQIIYIVNKKDLGKYSQFLAGNLGERCKIEAIKVAYPKTFLEKCFHFFYSYLVYTGTTKTLATIGMRLDEPTAGGPFRRFLAPVKVGIARTFGRSLFIKNRVVPVLYAKIFTSRPAKELFDRYHPDLVFAPHIYGKLDTEILAEAYRRGIKTLGMVACWDHFDKFYLSHKPDRLLAQCEQVQDFGVRFQGYRRDRIELVGYPHFDFFTKKEFAVSREHIMRRLGFPKESKYILYISGTAYCPDEADIIGGILQWAESRGLGHNARIVIRPYPGARARDVYSEKEKFGKFETHPRVVFYKNEIWEELEKSIFFLNIMRHADAIVAVYSTAMLEAVVLDRPLIGIGFDGYKKRSLQKSIRRFQMREHFKDILKSGCIRIAGNFDELFSLLDGYFKNPERDADKRALLRKKFCGTLDGNVSERIARHILTTIEAKPL